MLAGIIRGPTLYSPLINWTSAKNRQRDVLQAMLRDRKDHTGGGGESVRGGHLTAVTHVPADKHRSLAVDFVRYTTDQLIQQFGSDMTYGGGLHVITTLNVTAAKPGSEHGQRATSPSSRTGT